MSYLPQVKQVLMCKPTYFRVEYQINPWMDPNNPINHQRAISQWQKLVTEYKSAGIHVHQIMPHPELPDMVFAADQAINTEDGTTTLLISNHTFSQRRPESGLYRRWLEQHNYKIVQPTENTHIEGQGETVWFKQQLLIGYGYRSNQTTIKALKQYIDDPIIPLQLVDPRFYHLDTCLFIADQQTICYYPAAFSTKSQIQIEKLAEFTIHITPTEAQNFAANCLSSGTHIFIQTGNSNLEEQLCNRGFTVHAVDVSEFHKAGGSIHCLTLVLPN